MSAILGELALLTGFAILSWAFVFGILGFAVARACGLSPAAGAAWGFVAGPVGWMILLTKGHPVPGRLRRTVNGWMVADAPGDGPTDASEAPDVL